MEIFTPERQAEALALRNDEDLTWKQVAKRMGVPEGEWQHVRDAAQGTGDYAPLPEPVSKLDALEQQVKDTPAADEDEIERAAKDRTLSEDELDQIERIYHGGMNDFTVLGEALDPPVSWITIQEALASRGAAKPGVKVPTYSTYGEEGQRQYQQDIARGAFTVPKPR